MSIPLYTYHSDNSEKYKWVFDGECSDGYEVRLEMYQGREERQSSAHLNVPVGERPSSDSWTTGGVDIKRSTVKVPDSSRLQLLLVRNIPRYDCSRINNGY